MPSNPREKRKWLLMPAIVALLILPLWTYARSTADHDFPRTAAWQLHPGKSSAETLAQFDAVILAMGVHRVHPELIEDIKRLSPDTLILAYTTSVGFPAERVDDIEPSGDGLWHQVERDMQPEWRLRTWEGKQLSTWPGHWSMNLVAESENGQTYADYFGNFLAEKVLSSGMYDGILFDTTWHTISWLDEDVDIDADGRKDPVHEIDEQWRRGLRNLLTTVQDGTDEEYLLITNGAIQIKDLNNGRMFESFPEYWEEGWPGSIQRYFANEENGNTPRANFINVDTNNTGNFDDYAKTRFGLTSTLLGDGYYNFDYGTLDRSFVPYYDEYDISLGEPLERPVNLMTASREQIERGVWKREFENGISLVNSTRKTRKVRLSQEYKKIDGKQDPYVNNGRVVNEVIIPPRDGIVLLRK